MPKAYTGHFHAQADLPCDCSNNHNVGFLKPGLNYVEMERLKILLRYVLATRICLDMNTLIQKKPYLCQTRQANTQTSLRTRAGSSEYSLLACAKYGSIFGRSVQNLISSQFVCLKKVFV